MDRALRELERSCEEARGDATLWARLAHARLRASLRPAEALAAVRAGLRADPSSVEVARARDAALATFWKAPSFRRLWTREGTTGEQVAFSHDGSRIAVAG
ncbi:hypothetical protein HY251_02380, partial [bacterium]|nr:hypothetical protein [bacterium]